MRGGSASHRRPRSRSPPPRSPRYSPKRRGPAPTRTGRSGITIGSSGCRIRCWGACLGLFSREGPLREAVVVLQRVV
ncbi:putative serrate RNA effector molecule [Iris pallida]|uniref:Serrate RNA effector molecule n=1 Tax=Iris pallida TaxID=29817 RepID=A0AAX6F768_IRIPA|nr:putative serrate RNA effector molecule [Iris pallida]